MIYVLTLLACLNAHPDRCQRWELQVEACNALGIGQIARWAGENPAWRVMRWHCGETEI